MKNLLTAISVLALAITTGNFTNYLSTNIQKSNILNNNKQQDTIYIDKDSKQITTNDTDLWMLDIKEIIQIGFYKNGDQIQVVRMPIKVEKVPEQLPSEITSLRNMFFYASSFNGDISNWDTSNVTYMSWMFDSARSFNQDLSSWNVDKVTNYMFFSYWSGIDNPNKLPKWKH